MNIVKAKIKILKIDDMNLKNISEEQIDKTQQLNDILNKLDEEENFDDDIWMDFPFRKAN